MIILDDESTTAERSPLKSPSSPVTSRYDAGSSPPPYHASSSSHPQPNSVNPNTPLSPPIHPPAPVSGNDEERDLRRRTLRRFFSAFLVAGLIALTWSFIVRALSLALLFKQPNTAAIGQDADPVSSREPSFSLPFIRWPHVFPSPSPCPTVTVTVRPTSTVTRIFSIAYPPPTRTSS